MDWFKKQKLSNWIIGALIIANVITLSSLWMIRIQHSKHSFRPRDAGRGKELMVMRLLKEELHLGDEQVEEFRAMRHQHFKGFRAAGQEMMELRRGLMDAMYSDPPDTLRVKELADVIGTFHIERELKNAQHFQLLSDICTPEQRKKLKLLINEILPHPPSGAWRGRRGKGEMPFGRRGREEFKPGRPGERPSVGK
ncbi:periplasmic heavy metal sensor [bacterium]|nr:periplasmic heavy metal sensor [bacterium]